MHRDLRLFALPAATIFLKTFNTLPIDAERGNFLPLNLRARQVYAGARQNLLTISRFGGVPRGQGAAYKLIFGVKV